MKRAQPRSTRTHALIPDTPLFPSLADAIPLIDFHEAPPSLPWTLEDAVALCRKIEKIAPEYGAHVALTGGTLYKDGPRKDVDPIFYRIRQVKEIDRPRLIRALPRIGIEI